MATRFKSFYEIFTWPHASRVFMKYSHGHNPQESTDFLAEGLNSLVLFAPRPKFVFS